MARSRNTDAGGLKLTFSGHQTFHCRPLWLKKGYDFVKGNGSFNDERAVVELGIGNNMVASVHYWMRAFGLIDEFGRTTQLADFIFDSREGRDPFLEMEGTLWLLHRQLVAQKFASSYSLIFNELRRERIEFSKEHFQHFVRRKVEEAGGSAISEKTLASDFEVFLRMYHRKAVQTKDKEDTLAGILTELNIVQLDHRGEREKSALPYCAIPIDEKPGLPDEVVLYSILDGGGFEKSVSLYSLEMEENQVGSIFALSRAGLQTKLEAIAGNKDFKSFQITFNDHAGVKELQVNNRPNDNFKILDKYYK